MQQLNHIFNEVGEKESLDSLLNGDMVTIWGNSLSNELGRLAQGIRDITGNDVIDFITKDEVPSHKKVTYTNRYNLRQKSCKIQHDIS